MVLLDAHFEKECCGIDCVCSSPPSHASDIFSPYSIPCHMLRQIPCSGRCLGVDIDQIGKTLGRVLCKKILLLYQYLRMLGIPTTFRKTPYEERLTNRHIFPHKLFIN